MCRGFQNAESFRLQLNRHDLIAECVCPVCTCVNKVNTKVPEGGSPLCAGSYPEALASRKLVCRETCSEESETAKLGSNEQELDTEAL